MIRIIGGRWKRKSLNVLDYSSLRPTPSRVRETVFNWISTRLSLSDASVLDLFSGSGALGIEAASRGAKEVQLVESNIVAVKQIQSFISDVDEFKNINIQCKDAFEWLRSNRNQIFDLIFLDPPFESNMLEKVLPLVINFINNDGLIYIESEKKVSDFCISLGYKIVCSGKSGSVRYHLITIE